MSRRLRLSLALAVTVTVPPALGCGGGGMPGAALAPAGAGVTEGQKPATAPAAPNAAPAERRIIYTATLDVVVQDLDAARAEVDKVVTAAGGYVGKSEVRNDSNTRRSASFTLRVPVAQFKAVHTALAALGVAERDALDSQDVTVEYADVQARVRTLQAEEEALNKLLRESGSREDTLKTREQIRGVRVEIDQSEARLKTLASLTSLSTIHLTLREVKNYQPPTAPTFATRAGQTFAASWEAVTDFAEGVALVAVALTPWLPVLLPFGLLAFWLFRKAWRAANTRPEPPRFARPRARPVEPDAPRAEEPPAG